MCTDCPARLAADPTAAFPVLVAHHADLVYGLALRSTGRPADAEDLAQETFVRAWRAIGRYDRERIEALHLRGWLARIVLNLARNRARARPASPDVDLGAAVEAADPGAEGQPEAAAERRETAREWRGRLDRLPPRYRLAVELRHVDGLSYPEIATALERPVGTVKSDVHRGVRLLREQLEGERETRPMEAAR